MDRLLQDLRYALRQLRASPGFTATAVFTIALGIGATTAIFSVVNTVLLRPLPYAEPERLVLIQSDLRARNVTDFAFPPGDLPDLRDQGTLFSGVAAVVTNRAPLLGQDGQPEQIVMAFGTTNLFSLLEGRTALGRGFVETDGTPLPPLPAPGAGAPQQPPPAPPPTVAVLSHGYWQRRYGGEPNALGQIGRSGDFLVARPALGAGRRDLVRQMLAESVLLAGAGAVAGVVLAVLGLDLLRAIASPGLPRIDDVGIDVAVLGFTALAAVAAAVTFGLVPALRASRINALGALRSAGRTAGLAAGRRLRGAVVVAEVILAFVLLIGSGLMIRSFLALV